MTTDFSRTYSPPGVYIDETETTIISTGGVPPTTVGIAGPARGFQTYTEQVPLGADAVRLSQPGVDVDSVVVNRVSDGVEVASTKYTVTAVTGQTTYFEIVEAGGNDLPEGEPVFVAYQYTVPGYFDPKKFDNFEDVKDAYGEPLNLTPGTFGDAGYSYIVSPLSMAAKLAFDNGASEVYLCAAEAPGPEATTDAAKSTARVAALKAAYDKMETLVQVNVIVGITDGIAEADAATAISDLKSHVVNATADGFLRFGMIGFDPAVTTAPDALLGTAGAANRRLQFAYAGPGGLLMYSGPGNANFAVGHQYLAAAYAGMRDRLPVQQALTKQPVSGFVGLAGTPLSNSLKNQYAAAGIALVEINRRNQIVVRHDVTTDPTNVNTRESSVVRARDALVTMLQNGSDNSGLIGQPLDEDLLLSVKSGIAGMLEQATSEGAIVSYKDLAVRQVGTDPVVVEVKFSYKPAYPLNYIVISFSIDMSTGTTDITDEAA